MQTLNIFHSESHLHPYIYVYILTFPFFTHFHFPQLTLYIINSFSQNYPSELANSESSKACLGQLEERNKRVVRDFYKALTSKDTQTLYGLVAQDLEWWFHGPPCHRHHLVPWLTGSSPSPPSSVPDLVVGFGSVVVAEGYDETNLIWWVHAWTVNENGVITQVREYVNTALTVTQLGVATSPSQAVQNASKCFSIWKSTLSDESVPGLILTI